MLDIVKHITANDKEYPLAFTYNVMEAIQDKFGSMNEWGKALQPTEKVIDEETGKEIVKALEPKIKDIIWTLEACINEGIDIENEEKAEKKQFLTSKQIGRLLSAVGMAEISKTIKNLTVDSTRVDNSKNELTTQI